MKTLEEERESVRAPDIEPGYIYAAARWVFGLPLHVRDAPGPRAIIERAAELLLAERG